MKASYREFDDRAFEKAKDAFQRGAQNLGVKIILPLRILVQRILNENLGFVDLHIFFLRLCNHYFVPKEALPIL